MFADATVALERRRSCFEKEKSLDRLARNPTPRIGSVAAECLALCGLIFLAGTLAKPSASEPKRGVSPEEEWMCSWYAHQLFGCEPDQLSDPQSSDVARWSRCVAVAARWRANGMQRVTHDECQDVVETLEDLCPHLSEHKGYSLVYNACRQRLADDASAAD